MRNHTREKVMKTRERISLAANIFAEHGPAIRAAIGHCVRNSHDADDLYQDVFLSLVRTPPSSLTYLVSRLGRIVKNHAIDAVRRSASYGSCLSRYAALQRRDTAANDPQVTVASEEQACRIGEMVRTALPPHMANVIIERHGHGHSIAETAAHLGIRQRTVSRYCCVGLQEIRKLIEEGKIEPEDFL
jgi:RNA polymerase sigma factor (sigma-70 family)